MSGGNNIAPGRAPLRAEGSTRSEAIFSAVLVPRGRFAARGHQGLRC